jgi:hypothetical protein
MKFAIVVLLGYASAQSNTDEDVDVERPDW